MACSNGQRSKIIHTFMFAGLLAAALVASTAIPALAAGFNKTGSMNAARESHTATLLANGNVLVTGGDNFTDGFLASAELYNPATGKWTFTGSMTTARVSHDAVLLPNGQVLVAGGYHDSNCCLASAELYNPATGTWTATGSMTVGNDTNWAVLLQNGEVFVLNDNLYNPSTGTWAGTAKDPIFAHAPLAQLLNGEVYAAGTVQGDSIYNPATNQWINFAPPPCTTTKQNCEGGGALLSTGKVLVAGGITEVPGQPYPTAETNGIAALLDPSTLTWATTQSMKESRVGETVTVLLNGEVLFAGGDTFNKSRGALAPIASAEFYKP
jgi:hypothetical protein